MCVLKKQSDVRPNRRCKSATSTRPRGTGGGSNEAGGKESREARTDHTQRDAQGKRETEEEREGDAKRQRTDAGQLKARNGPGWWSWCGVRRQRFEAEG